MQMIILSQLLWILNSAESILDGTYTVNYIIFLGRISYIIHLSMLLNYGMMFELSMIK